MQKDKFKDRALEEARYIIDHKATVRQAAANCSSSKSVVHKDVTVRLPDYNPFLADEVREILDHNKAERHIRGGMAIRQKYLSIKGK